MHRVLYSALGQAERWKLISRNTAPLLEKKDRPKIERKAVTTIDAPTTAMVLDMDIYSHLTPNMQGEAAAAVDGVLRAAINKRTDDVG
jgi:hypothetical protein